MSSLGRERRTGAAAVLALGLAAAAGGPMAASQTTDAAQISRALAANGAVVEMPRIEELDCESMSKVLHRIDLSGYRDTAPVPERHPDWPIFDYEDRLSRLYYRSCILRDHTMEDPGAAFAPGFDAQ